MPDSVSSRIFRIPLCCLIMRKLKYTKFWFYQLFCVGVKLGLSHRGRSVAWRSSRIRELREILGPKWDEVTGDWRKLHNKELHALYSSPNFIRLVKLRRYEMGWACGMYGGGTEMHTGFFGGEN